jgi:hypothetical protein
MRRVKGESGCCSGNGGVWSNSTALVVGKGGSLFERVVVSCVVANRSALAILNKPMSSLYTITTQQRRHSPEFPPLRQPLLFFAR